MTRKSKLIARLRSRPKDFTWDELQRLLEGLGYTMVDGGKTGGSRRRFTHLTGPTISLHKPHPSNILKMYVIRNVISALEKEKMI
ncbi:MAG: type II toxin-antitoxin system HicA family toxin [Sneathiella sp.]